MRQMMGRSTTRVLNITQHIILRNGWEYYVTDDKHNKDTVRCLVMGFETELGDVYLPELQPYIMSRTTNLADIMPAEGYEWVS